jgi:cation:H+ antiporter
MNTVIAIAVLVAGVAIVVAGAELFFDGVLSSAARLRVSPYALIVVLSGLEFENLAAGIALNVRDLPGASAGTFLGGSVFLALGVAGFSALVAPLRPGLPGKVLAWTAATPVVLAALVLDGELSRIDGALLLVWFAIALTGMVRGGGFKPELAPERRRFALLKLGGGLAILSVGGAVLGDGMRRVVDRVGVSDVVLGNTAIAAAVEAEEIGRVVAPARRGRGELALANVTATIVHFAALNAGIIALVKPLPFDGATLDVHVPATVAATAIVCGLVALRRGLGRWEGVALVVLYAGYVAIAIAAG